ncbi:type II toxin-antitoxin system RelE/ParE family toxin [Pararobbsia alpina]|uniref:type II toxin-antitoxin system RelE/ParE family toxin n=1 Tax=Pararobbsia alpina TaxID=621374 RepID=UPI0015829243|nr:type II toxin-antitoxin system RelE/ParE family toxin [Pararobbsia alpina]
MFHAFVKKQHGPLQLAIEDAVEDICADPNIGEQKAGDLSGIWVYKFKHNRQEYLVAYRPPTDDEMQAEGVDVELLLIDFCQVGSHENF